MSNNWKEKVSGALHTAQDEIKKATSIGKKMINASKTNSQLKEQYENIGRYLIKALDEDKLHVDDSEIIKMKEEISRSEARLHEIEQEVSDIKKS